MDRKRVNQYIPDEVSPPGDTLLEVLESRGLTQADVASRTGRTPKLINEIVKGKAPITHDTAIQLERVLGIPADFWNRREAQYREALARSDEGKQLADEAAWLRLFPIRAMARLGWIRKSNDDIEQLREVLNFFGVASPESWEGSWKQVRVSYRKSRAFRADIYALRAWLRKGELEGQATGCPAYDAAKFRYALTEIRKLTTEEPRVFQPRLVERCASCGVVVVFIPELPKIRASGATRWLTPTKALIQLNLRYKKDDHFWFTLFHEAGHVLHDSKKVLFVDTEEFEGEHEERANAFAAEQLVPQVVLREFVTSERPLSRAAILDFARTHTVAPGIVVGQLQHQGHLPYSHCNDLKRTFVWAAGGE